MELRKAEKAKSKLRIGMSGPSGSGKTYSALLLASGMTSFDKICVIDTENGSADLYSNLGTYNVLQLEAPYSPERYIEAIDTAVNAGMEVIIIDSATHEWDGKGGCLEINELLAQTKFRGNTWSAWSQTTPRHQKFLDKILNSNCHFIITTRSKTETIQTEDKKVKKVGMKEIQRDGFEYELTLNFSIDRDKHYATASKDRTGMFIDVDPFVISKQTGEMLIRWAENGVERVASPKPLEQTIIKTPIIVTREEPKKVECFDEFDEKAIEEAFSEGIENPLPPLNQPVQKPKLPASDKQRKMIYALSNKLGKSSDEMKSLMKQLVGKEHSSDLDLNEAKKIIDYLLPLSNEVK